MYKLIFYVPKADAQSVKKAIFATGAGSLGNYSECSFEVEGTGQFRPNSKANPAIGRSNKLEKVIELKVEILCTEENISNSVEALRKSHPYVEPAFEIIKVYNNILE